MAAILTTEQRPAILVVDDVAANRKAMRILLRAVEADIVEAASGNEALARVLEREFALVLLDVHMPGMDGYEVADLLRSEPRTRTLPIIFVTAVYKDEAHRIRGYEMGAVDYVEKPVDEGMLLAKAKAFLEIEERRRQLQDLNRQITEQNRLLKQEIALRIEAQEELRKLAEAVQQSPSGVVISDAREHIEFANPRFEEMCGYRLADLKDRELSWLTAKQTPQRTGEALAQAQRRAQLWRGELCLKTADHGYCWVYAVFSPILKPTGEHSHYLALFEDITLRKEYEERLLRQANFDQVTELPNRILALDRLSQSMATAKRARTHLIILFVDLNEFRNVNETLGFEIGNRLLAELARRLEGQLRSGDTVARLGGDEFLLILHNSPEPTGGEVAAERVLATVSEPFLIGSHEICVSASVGVAYAPQGEEGPSVLVQNAEAAMYRAKSAGRNTYRFFTPELNREVRRRLDLEARLRHALDRGELAVHFQPVVQGDSGRVLGAEALARWDTAELGRIPPSEFIPIAEATGLIHALGAWVLDEAVAQAAGWYRQYGAALSVAVNVSSVQFQRGDLLKRIEAIAAGPNFHPGLLNIEITEGLLLHGGAQTLAVLNRLRELGVGIAIDDFGTGYSSLGYIKRFPITLLKIDQSFVRDIGVDPDDQVLVRTIIAMGHALGIDVVAEGVETEEQLGFLQDEGCDQIQGYYYSRPLAPEHFVRYLQERLPGA